MTRKHYRLIADALRTSSATKEVVATLSTALLADNSRFNWETFVSACGYEPADFVSAGHFGPTYLFVS